MRKLIAWFAVLATGAVGGIFGWREIMGDPRLEELLGENRQLKRALSNLNETEQVGYAKVMSQERSPDGRLFTQLLLVQTAPGDPSKRVAEHVYEIEGDVVFFDALIVKFEPRLVESGEQRALFIWRRIYGEQQKPSEGFPVTPGGKVPERYDELMDSLGEPAEAVFWDGVWSLANDPQALRKFGIQATYGNAVYSQLKPGLIYALKANSSGQVYPEVYPDL